MFDLPEFVTIWNEQSNDGGGGLTFTDPVTVPSRQALKQEKFTDVNGDQRMSTAVCYSDEVTLKIGSMVFFGKSKDSTPPAGANDVRAISQVPSGSGDLKKCWFS